jgi:hypothetical protein
MMEAVRTSKTSVYFNETTRRYIQDGCIHTRCHEDLETRIWKSSFYNNLRHPGMLFSYV